MKKLSGFFAGFGIIGVLAFVALWCFMVGSMAYGIYLAFSASILLGVLVLFIPPSPVVIGLVMIFFHKNLAQIVLDFLTK